MRVTKGELDAKRTAAGWEAQDRGLVLPAGRTRRGSPPGVYFRLHELAELAPDAEPPPRPSSRALLTDRERERADQYRRLMAPEGDGA